MRCLALSSNLGGTVGPLRLGAATPRREDTASASAAEDTRLFSFSSEHTASASVRGLLQLAALIEGGQPQIHEQEEGEPTQVQHEQEEDEPTHIHEHENEQGEPTQVQREQEEEEPTLNQPLALLN